MFVEQQQLARARQRVLANIEENERVLEEMNALGDDEDSEVIYKLIGPVLVAQDRAEAKNNVEKRLDYFKQERFVVNQSTTTAAAAAAVVRNMCWRLSPLFITMYRERIEKKIADQAKKADKARDTVGSRSIYNLCILHVQEFTE